MGTTANLEPHPLVPQVASGLIALGVPLVSLARPLLVVALKNAVPKGGRVQGPSDDDLEAKLTELAQQLAVRPPLVSPKPKAKAKPPAGRYSADLKDKAALALAGATGVPELVTFAGYVGGLFPQNDKDWCVFYLDTRLTSWLLVDTNGIVFRDQLKDDYAACGLRDVIWVKSDAPVGLGNASEAAQAQFLTGQFTAAGDIDPAAGRGTLDAATGVFCEARSVGCCKNNTGSRYCKP